MQGIAETATAETAATVGAGGTKEELVNQQVKESLKVQLGIQSRLHQSVLWPWRDDTVAGRRSHFCPCPWFSTFLTL